MEHGVLCVAICVCSSHSISVPSPCLECVHASVHEFMFTWLPISAPSLCIVWWKPGCPCMAVCLCPSHLISVPTPCLEWVQAPVHAFMSTWLPMSAPPLCIVWWKPGCSHMAVCLCLSHLISGLTPCLECLHALVHVFMSTLLPRSAASHMHSFMET